MEFIRLTDVRIMKKYIIILSLLLFVGCNTGSSTSSTSSEPSCTALTTAYVNTSTAWQEDMANSELCEANSAALLALIDAECPGFPNYTQAEINVINSMCDFLIGG